MVEHSQPLKNWKNWKMRKPVLKIPKTVNYGDTFSSSSLQEIFLLFFEILINDGYTEDEATEADLMNSINICGEYDGYSLTASLDTKPSAAYVSAIRDEYAKKKRAYGKWYKENSDLIDERNKANEARKEKTKRGKAEKLRREILSLNKRLAAVERHDPVF